MPFTASVEGNFGYGRQQQQQVTPGTDIKVSGNGTANLSTTGLTALTGVAGQDDIGVTFPVPIDFFFFGTNYGNGNNTGIYWNTNNVIGFGTPVNTITWLVNTGRGVLIGNTDRRTNTFHYSTTKSTASGYDYVNFVLFAQNNYNDNVPNAIQWQIRLFRSASIQYIEVRASTAPSTGGTWNITNGTAFQNTYGAFTNVTAGSSFVLQSDGNGNNWQFFNNYRIPI
jgi:hypothetical protein